MIQECLNTVLRKAEIPLDTDATRAYLDTILTPLFRVPASIALYQRGLDIQRRYRYGFYDSLIIAAALEAGCTRLYREDLQHGAGASSGPSGAEGLSAVWEWLLAPVGRQAFRDELFDGHVVGNFDAKRYEIQLGEGARQIDENPNQK